MEMSGGHQNTACLLPGKNPGMKWRLFLPQNRPNRFGEEKNPLTLPVSCVTIEHCSVSL